MIKPLKGCIPYFVLGALCLACAFILDFTNAVILNYRVGLVLSFVMGIVVISVLVYKKVKDNLSLQKLFLYFSGALICIGSTFLLTQFNRGALLVIISGFLWVFYIGVVLYCEGKLSEKNIVLLIFLASFILRLGYIAYTPYNVRQHDVYNFYEDGSGSGHARYILWFFKESKLPDFDPREIWQFYHPPLHHIISGLWLRFLNLFGFSFVRLAESVQVLTLFYSCSCTIIFWRILGQLKVKGSAKLTAFLLMAFNPSFVIFSGSINNDILSITFMLLAVLYTIKWYNNQSFKNIIILAFAIGLAMMSKLSAALVAPAVAVVFLYCLVKNFKTEWKKLFSQFFVFGLICIPLGLWWSIRNFVLFKVPFGYVPLIASDVDQYIGFNSVFKRLFDFRLNDVFMAWGENRGGFFEYNPILSLFKTSLFGEFRLNESVAGEAIMPFANILFYFNILITLVAFFAMIYLLVKKGISTQFKLFSSCFYITVAVSYIQFCFNYPHTCTMNIRYATPLIILGLIPLSLLLKENIFKKIIARTVEASAVIFSVCTVAVYSLLAL